MTIREVRKRAKALGVDLKTEDKAEWIRAIQAAEKNPQCFQAGRTQCVEVACCWMADCIPSLAIVVTKEVPYAHGSTTQAGRGSAGRG
jgi:hypothetical protein